jgi:hypothetical protein
VIESLLVVALVTLLGVGYAAWALVPVDALLLLGVQLVAAGLLFGVPTGAVYHLALRRSLVRAGSLPRRWWLRPTSLHGRIPASDRARVLGWCFAGAAGFFVTVLGCALVALGAVRAMQPPG